MRLTLAAVALLAASGVAYAQTATSTSQPSAPATGANASNSVLPPGPPGSQTPSATVNSSPQSASNSPSAVQTSNTTQRTSAAPVPGRNSFTMSEAAGRIASAGYSDVTGLKKDPQGIWRGTAKKGGNTVPVSLDYQGNVTGK